MTPARIRRFLINRHGYYCEACLARTLGLSIDDVQHYTRRRETIEPVIRYRICHSCMAEKEVVGLRTCA